MKAEDAKKIAEQALRRLDDALRQGRSQALTEYLAMLARFHRYSFGNVLMIHSQCPLATHVAGFTAWKALGRHVKKGEKGIVILAPMSVRAASNVEDEKPEGERSKRVLRFRGVFVFDVSQTEGEPLPQFATVSGESTRGLESLRAEVVRRGIALDHDDLPAGALGVSRGGRISISPGLTAAQEFAVLAHELAHELLHRDESRPASKTVRETEAEAVAFVVCTAAGLETSTASSDYIQLYDGKSETLAASLHRIQRTAAEIILAVQGTGDGQE